MYKKVIAVLFSIASLYGYQCPDINIKIFTKENPWNWNISKTGVHKDSDAFLRGIGPQSSLKPDFGARTGIPYSIVESGKEVVVNFNGKEDDSDKGPYRIPVDAPRENGPDRRVIVIDVKNHNLYELLQGSDNGVGEWNAFSGAIFNLDTNALRKADAYSADPAGMAIFPGLVRYQDILRGEVNHAIRAVVPIIDSRYVYPARNSPALKRKAKPKVPVVKKDDKVLGEKEIIEEEEKYPAMGQRFRLKNDVDITKLGKQAQVIAAGLKNYGFIVADRGYKPYIYGTLDERWDDKDLATLSDLLISDFEAVVEINAVSRTALDPYEKTKVYGGPFKRGKNKVGVMNIPAGKVVVKVLDSKKVLVKELLNEGLLLYWDMKDISGKDVEPGEYFISIEEPKRVLKTLPVKVE